MPTKSIQGRGALHSSNSEHCEGRSRWWVTTILNLMISASKEFMYQIHASSCLHAFFWYLNDLDINNYKWERGDAPTHHRCCVELFSLFFWLFWRCVGCEWKLELHNVNQVKLQMWHQSTLSTMRPGFNTSTTPTPPTIPRWQYFLKSWVLFFSKIVHHFLLKANLIFLRSSGQSGDLVTEVVSTNIMGIFFVQNHVYNLPFDEPS